ncbi:MAG: anthranilate phosphoribosyltransferase [Actinomycetota bacterium]
MTETELSPDFWPGVLSRLVDRDPLSVDESANAMRAIMQGQATPAQVAGFLMALRTRGETVDELEGFARAALEFAQPVKTPGPAVDTCGTGGDKAGTFNVSTLAAIAAAGAGALVAKHGNRAASSDCGSADLLEELGVKIDLGAEGVERCLEEASIGFMFAPVFHPAMKYAVGIRRELRVPTVFNFLGPLTNPARPEAQIVGVSDARMLPLVANALARRGTRATVFQGLDGLDELTVTMSSVVYDVAEHQVKKRTFDPDEIGFDQARAKDLKGGDVAENAAIAREILAGEKGPKRDMVVLNAGAALEVSGKVGSLKEGVEQASGSIDSGAAAKTLETWIEVSQKA